MKANFYRHKRFFTAFSKSFHFDISALYYYSFKHNYSSIASLKSLFCQILVSPTITMNSPNDGRFWPKLMHLNTLFVCMEKIGSISTWYYIHFWHAYLHMYSHCSGVFLATKIAVDSWDGINLPQWWQRQRDWITLALGLDFFESIGSYLGFMTPRYPCSNGFVVVSTSHNTRWRRRKTTSATRVDEPVQVIHSFLLQYLMMMRSILTKYFYSRSGASERPLISIDTTDITFLRVNNMRPCDGLRLSRIGSQMYNVCIKQ